LSIFSWKKSESSDENKASTEGAAASPVEFSPQKAEKFFQHARTVYDTGNYEYAMQLWLNGLRWDPNSVVGIEGFFTAISGFDRETGGKRGPSKDTLKNISGKSEVDKYIMSLMDWGLKHTDASLAVKASELAAKLGLIEPTRWLTDRAFGFALQEKKVRKDLLLRCAECFGKAGMFEKALRASEEALKLDQTDGELAAKIRSLAAQATMTKGGFDKPGQEGGFRANIRDADKQRLLEEADRIVKTDETIDRLIVAAQEEMVKRPSDIPTIERYGKLLLERGRPRDEEAAYKLYSQTFDSTQQFRFRELAGDIRMRQSRRGVGELRVMLEKNQGNEDLTRMLAQAEEDHAKLELEEYKLRVANYPSDLPRRFEYGKRLFALAQYHDAIEQFQEAQQEPRNRGEAMLYLGQSFQRIGWLEEAIDTFRHASEIKDMSPERAMEVRYFLMISLQDKAAAEGDLPSIEEADRLASMIARQQMSYRDIRVRRDEIKAILNKLRNPNKAGSGGGSPPASES